MTLYLTEEEVAGLLTIEEAIEAVEQCFLRLARGVIDNRPRTRLPLEDGQLAVMAVNWVIAMAVPPRPLPRMDFSAGIPASSRTLVAVPAMLVVFGILALAIRTGRRESERELAEATGPRTTDARFRQGRF